MPVTIDLTACDDTLLPITQRYTITVDLTACDDTLLLTTHPFTVTEVTAVEITDSDDDDDAILIPAHEVVVLPIVEPIAPAA